ncbi:aldehyde dehydrogenase family protein [Nocardioides zeae]|uniref:Acyl-CoA reductase-like NAD-dependent aldehyde dehydrogenase n=1 Tax=Nocardioides zeae TaxID=1457234 RepID=A0AAJ1X2M9_9ACTN|nr:aldehyde dehydrogenase family protein [Nocardioides zeae]MDQ1105454.1 acyl-CoA reductase-like NAD-dependent aldehyde dehydrogenase [Nocardioides zeae]
MSIVHDVDLFVGGEWLAAGERVPATSPATGELIAEVSQGGRVHVARAVASASTAFDKWSRTNVHERAALLHRLADICLERKEELARALTLDQGKALYAEAYHEVDDLVGYWRGAAEDAIRLAGDLPSTMLTGSRVLVERRPVGVVGVITPWNWPYTMPAQIIAPALAVGNAVVWVPAPSTTYCSAVLMRCIEAAGLPAGAVNFVPGPGPVVGDELAGHPDVAAIAFVGSTATGYAVGRRAAGKIQILEMGNNGPMVVMDDADLGRAVEGAIVGCFLNAGQSCAAAERILVHRDVADEFALRLTEATHKDVSLGDPFDPETTMGPLNNEGVAAKMEHHVEDAIARGATLVHGGTARSDLPTSLYWAPTILTGVARDSVVAQEETFGPIAPIIPVDSLEDAIALTNALPYGLMASIYTRDYAKGLRYADSVKAAWVNINESSNHWEPQLPFGGGAGTHSGTGRVGGRYVLESLTQTRTVVLGGLSS